METKDKNKKRKKSSQKLPDHIEDYFAENEGSKESINSRELFNAENENIDLKTDLDKQAIPILAVLKFNDEFLKSRGLRPVFSQWVNPYMRLRISKERKSRGEFVSINKAGQDEKDFLEKTSNFKNILDSKK
ncbi:MAG: hypothetical protein ACOC56_05495 [Atribacterota bacterium]